PALPARDLVAAVMIDWRSTAVRGTRRRMVTALAMAATLLVAVLPAMRWWNNSRENAQPAPADSVATSSPRPADQSPPLVDQARETYGPLMAQTSESLSTALAALPIVEPTDSPSSAGESNTEEDRTIASDLAPVAQSATRSLVALLRVFPGSA